MSDSQYKVIQTFAVNENIYSNLTVVQYQVALNKHYVYDM